MNKLVFQQEDNERGSCRCLLNGVSIDGCDMNYKDKYTQAHIVLASVYVTLKTKDVDIEVNATAKCGAYPINEILSMAEYLIDDNFKGTHPYVRIYHQLLSSN
jgi:hypothetical protein